MNFFKLYIGDYQRDTAHLSIAEHGAYMLMLQHYYATEKPLPVGKALHRMLRAQDKVERDAIDSVCSQFWTETADGLINVRCDKEITKANAQADANREVAKAREAKRKAARNSNDLSTNRATNGEPNQTPDTRHQTPEEEIPGRTHTVLVHDAPACVEPQKPPEPRSQPPTAAGAACLAMRAVGVADVNPSSPKLAALLAAGATNAELAAAAKGAVDRGKGFAYALGTVQRQREEASSMASTLHKGPIPNRADALRSKNHAAMSDWLATQESQDAAS